MCYKQSTTYVDTLIDATRTQTSMIRPTFTNGRAAAVRWMAAAEQQRAFTHCSYNNIVESQIRVEWTEINGGISLHSASATDLQPHINKLVVKCERGHLCYRED